MLIPGQLQCSQRALNGYGGPGTSRFVADALPQRLLPALARAIRKDCGGLLDRKNCEEASSHIVDMLQKQIVELDYSLRGAVQRACLEPKKLSKEDTTELIREYMSTSVFARAAQGSRDGFRDRCYVLFRQSAFRIWRHRSRTYGAQQTTRSRLTCAVFKQIKVPVRSRLGARARNI